MLCDVSSSQCHEAHINNNNASVEWEVREFNACGCYCCRAVCALRGFCRDFCLLEWRFDVDVIVGWMLEEGLGWVWGGSSRQSGRLSESGRVQTKETRIDRCGFTRPSQRLNLSVAYWSPIAFCFRYDNKRCICTRGVMWGYMSDASTQGRSAVGCFCV